LDGWLIVLLIVVALFVLRGLAFAYLRWRAKRLLALMERYWKKEVTWGQVGGRKREIVRLFRVAQLTEPAVDRFHPAPFGSYIPRQLSAWENIFSRTGDVQQLVYDAFVEAKGYFTDEIRRSFIPVFWPSVFINLPADALVYVGVSPGAAAVRVSKIVTAVVGLVAAIFGIWRAAA
jgi:hypothetical protein